MIEVCGELVGWRNSASRDNGERTARAEYELTRRVPRADPVARGGCGCGDRARSRQRHQFTRPPFFSTCLSARVGAAVSRSVDTWLVVRHAHEGSVVVARLERDSIACRQLQLAASLAPPFNRRLVHSGRIGLAVRSRRSPTIARTLVKRARRADPGWNSEPQRIEGEPTAGRPRARRARVGAGWPRGDADAHEIAGGELQGG